MDYNIDMSLYGGVFAVPSSIVDNQLKLCNGDVLKLLLYLLRHSGERRSAKEISAATGLSEPQIKDSLDFWAELGILSEGRSSVAIESRIYETEEKEAPVVLPPPVLPEKKAPAEEKPFIQVADNVKIISGGAPAMTGEEALRRYRQSEAIRFLSAEVGKLLGKTVKDELLLALVVLYDFYEMPIDMILMLVHFCKSTGRASPARIKEKAKEFHDRGIDTHEKAEAYIMHSDEVHQAKNRIRSAMGISGRASSPTEEARLEKWIDEFKMSFDMIKLAYDKTVDRTGKLSFSYMDSILTDWNEKNIRTPEEVSAIDGEFRSKSGGGQNPSAGERKYSNASYDLEELKRNSLFYMPEL
ncbi:MAG: DnaD domain protein [Oscillospiraceae bacterium]|nr:DnaD domain protein [Oscillospiraceae bacterium]